MSIVAMQIQIKSKVLFKSRLFQYFCTSKLQYWFYGTSIGILISKVEEVGFLLILFNIKPNVVKKFKTFLCDCLGERMRKCT